MKTPWALTAAVALVFSLLDPSAAEPIDGRSASRWKAQPGWTPGRGATDFGVADKDGWLEFAIAGADKQMTWTLTPTPEELAAEPRYMVFRYKATNLSNDQGDYLLMAQDGSPQWRRYVGRELLLADGAEHTVAIDVLSYRPPEPIGQFALRIGPAVGGRGSLLAKIEFVQEVPAGVTPIAETTPEPLRVRLDFEKVDWKPSPDWVPRPPDRQDMAKTENGVRFLMAGQQKAMRWSAKAPAGLDVGKMPFVSIRYRAKGRFGPYGYAFYLSLKDESGAAKGSVSPMRPGDVDGDGRWHVFHTQLDGKGVGATMAVGIDALSPEAEIEMDYVEYSSLPPKTPMGEVLAFERRDGQWTAGAYGFTTVALPKSPTAPNLFMIPRMGIGSWFDTGHITVDGVPFEVPADPAGMLASGTVGEEALAVDLPGGTKEVLFLLAAAFPAEERFGANWKMPAPLRTLTEPERMTVELVYPDGTSDHMLPVHAAKGEYGVAHDIAVYAAHPSEGKAPSRMVLHDNLRNACFAILGVTANTGAPKVKEPEIQRIWYPPVKKPEMADAAVSFQMGNGLAWDKIESPMLGKAVRPADAPVFVLKLGEAEVPSTQWNVEEVRRDGRGTRAVLGYARGDIALRAVFEAKPMERNETMLSLDLSNAGKAPVTGTLFFPCVSGLKIGSAEETWYLSGRLGGVINRVACDWRDEIGENHPLQVDGFFNPSVGAGVCFMPRDMEEVFRWYRLSKDSAGCGYSLEFLPQTVKPGEKWGCAPTLVAAIPGDWKDQLAAYLAWVKTWYKPLVPRKQWFREVFAFGPGNPTAEMQWPVEERTDFVTKAKKIKEAIGACDYIHLFGWAKTDEYGHWGDYDHYEAVGGREAFVAQVRRCQKSGTPVGLYLDGYLVSTKSQKPSQEERARWAVRTEKGEMLFHKQYDAHSLCPYVPEWRDYLTAVYRRVAAEVKPSGMYLDELGKCMVHRTCYSQEHGHPSPMGMSPGERILIRQIREAVPPEIATYCEYVPADVASQFIDGAFGHVALYGRQQGYDEVAPHYVHLQRFACPDFKTFELIYYVPMANGNWFLLKYPFFNGDGYYLTGACLSSDDHACGFFRNVFRVQHAHADAFTSVDVEPLVRTEAPNLFANRFSTAKKTVWTLFNANYRTVRGKAMIVAHRDGAKYYDAWNNRPVEARIGNGVAELSFEIGPRSVGCVVQE